MSSLVLSILSPVWQAKLCRGLTEASRSRLDLTLDDAASFATAVQLGCGQPAVVHGGINGLLDIGRLADTYGIEHVHRAVEWEAARLLTIDTCAELLSGAPAAGMLRLEDLCQQLALGAFEAFAQTEGFMRLNEETLGALLDDDGLAVGREETVLSAVVRWMLLTGNVCTRGRLLLTKIRFQLMDEASLGPGGQAGELAPMVEGLQELLDEARADKLAGPSGLQQVALRAGEAMRRGWYSHCGPPREVRRHSGPEYLRWGSGKRCFALYREEVAYGMRRGHIGVALRSDVAVRLADRDHICNSDVVCMAIWREWIVVGHESGQIEIWEIARGTQGRAKRRGSQLMCIGTLDSAGHTGAVRRLGVSGGPASRLVSENAKELRVWVTGSTASTWLCERTIPVQQDSIFSKMLAVWGNYVATAHFDSNVRIWNLDLGSCEAILPGSQSCRVVDSAGVDTDGKRLVTVCDVRTLSIWETLSWTCIHKLNADFDLNCVAVSGGKIFGGLTFVVQRGAGQTAAVLVWDLQTLQKEGTLWIPDQRLGTKLQIDTIVVDGGELWALSDEKLLVWGWKKVRSMSQVVLQRDCGKRWALNTGLFSCLFPR